MSGAKKLAEKKKAKESGESVAREPNPDRGEFIIALDNYHSESVTDDQFKAYLTDLGRANVGVQALIQGGGQPIRVGIVGSTSVRDDFVARLGTAIPVFSTQRAFPVSIPGRPGVNLSVFLSPADIFADWDVSDLNGVIAVFDTAKFATYYGSCQWLIKTVRYVIHRNIWDQAVKTGRILPFVLCAKTSDAREVRDKTEQFADSTKALYKEMSLDAGDSTSAMDALVGLVRCVI